MSQVLQQLAKALKREGDSQSTLQFYERTYWLPIAQRLLADIELLDAIVAYHQRPVAFVVVREEHGVMADAQIEDSLTAANTAQGISAGCAEPGERFTVYALTDITEENPNA